MRELNDWERRNLMVIEELHFEADPIWGTEARVYRTARGVVTLSDRSGSFVHAQQMREQLANWSPDQKAVLTTWITDQNRLGNIFPIITGPVFYSMSDRKPLTFSAKLDRFFAYLNYKGHRVGKAVAVTYGMLDREAKATQDEMMRWVEAINDAELAGFLAALQDMRFLDAESRLTGEGLLRLDGQNSQGAANDQAFVAMWFNNSTEEAYEKGIVPALSAVGYRAMRIDQKEHSNKIDDEIIAEIRRSRFLVADFTSGSVNVDGEAVQVPRGGVYYEAGFAQGLNMPVIWMVREDQINLVHFDTRQFNHIVWSDPEDLRVKLSRRVAAVLGFYQAQG